MADAKRYTVEDPFIGHDEDPNGDWRRQEDYAALQEQLREETEALNVARELTTLAIEERDRERVASTEFAAKRNARVRALEQELDALKTAIATEPRNKTLLPAFAQKLWEDMLAAQKFVELAVLKRLFDYIETVEGKLAATGAARDGWREAMRDEVGVLKSGCLEVCFSRHGDSCDCPAALDLAVDAEDSDPYEGETTCATFTEHASPAGGGLSPKEYRKSKGLQCFEYDCIRFAGHQKLGKPHTDSAGKEWNTCAEEGCIRLEGHMKSAARHADGTGRLWGDLLEDDEADTTIRDEYRKTLQRLHDGPTDKDGAGGCTGRLQWPSGACENPQCGWRYQGAPR